jgi:transcriptional regulator with XRE-family HTH domain
MANTVNHPPDDEEIGATDMTVGDVLRRARRALGMSLRAVQAATGNAVTNGYLSQIENNTVARPSPNVLYHLSQVYDIDYGALLVRAGHHLPADQASAGEQALPGLPLRAIEGLTPQERAELVDYIEYLRFRRGSSGRTS